MTIAVFHKTHNVVIMWSQPCRLLGGSRSELEVSPLSLRAGQPRPRVRPNWANRWAAFHLLLNWKGSSWIDRTLLLNPHTGAQSLRLAVGLQGGLECVLECVWKDLLPVPENSLGLLLWNTLRGSLDIRTHSALTCEKVQRQQKMNVAGDFQNLWRQTGTSSRTTGTPSLQ